MYEEIKKKGHVTLRTPLSVLHITLLPVDQWLYCLARTIKHEVIRGVRVSVALHVIRREQRILLRRLN